jgi:succinate dehydrogenase / fumarate reductase flavoprotein subunit
MGGLWVDYDLMTTIPGLFAIGEANFSDHGANRLGASALMQALADGYFVVPLSVGGYLAGTRLGAVSTSTPAVRETIAEASARLTGLLGVRGRCPASDIHRRLGQVLWDACGLVRSAQGLRAALPVIEELTATFQREVSVPGDGAELNQELEPAGRVADFLELAELMVRDALARDESAGCHFREEHQEEDGEALRDDARFAHVAAWKCIGAGRAPERLVESLVFEAASPSTRSYK